MEGQLVAAILSLAGLIYGGGLATIRYLLQQIEKRDAQIERLTAAAMATNQTNAQLAALYTAEQVKRTAAGEA